MVALDLVSRHPEQVSTLVAHEPAVTQLLPAKERARAVDGQRAIEETYASSGVRAAMAGFAALLKLDFTDREPDAPAPAPDPQKARNFEFFLTYDAPAVRTARLDIEALKRASTRIIPAAGVANAEVFTHRATVCLAQALGVDLEQFPGGHAGVSTHPSGFARRVLELLA
jgi:pimeloyl-ACP methyl ester carboxylesterase